jgi:hypothetical protein
VLTVGQMARGGCVCIRLGLSLRVHHVDNGDLLLGIQLGSAPPDPAARPGRGEARLGALTDHGPFKPGRGLGMHYPKAASMWGTSVLQTALASLVAPTLTWIDWMAEKLGAPGSTIRRWLEKDLSTLCKRKTLASIKREGVRGYTGSA